MTCRGMKKTTGEPCRSATQIDSDYCYTHGPQFKQMLSDKRSKIHARQQQIKSEIEESRKKYYGSWYKIA